MEYLCKIEVCISTLSFNSIIIGKKDKEVGRNIESMVGPETYKKEVNVKKVCRNVL